MKPQNSSTSLAYVSWISLFLLGWLILLRLIPVDVITWVFFAVFAIVGVFASAIASPPNKKDGIISPDDLIVKMDGHIYSLGDGTLFIGPERPDGKMIVIVNRPKTPPAKIEK